MIGQDPYPFGYHADGLAFSSSQEDTPASLRFILREVDRDVIKTTNQEEYKQAFPTNKLDSWAKQGVLLLNPSLTVQAGQPGSHDWIGWHQFTGKILQLILKKSTPVVFTAWGKAAETAFQTACLKVDEPGFDHPVFLSGHPASGAHGKDKFSGCNHFSKINYYFYRKGLPEINWKLNGV
jgi:uracil-DNA glycosylase